MRPSGVVVVSSIDAHRTASDSIFSISNASLHTFFRDNNTPKGQIALLESDPANLRIEPVSVQRVFKKHSLLTRRASDIAYGEEIAERVRKFAPAVTLSANTPLDAQRRIMAAAQSRSG